MASGDEPDDTSEAFWREFLTRGDSREQSARKIFKHIPHGPRCRLCAAPFEGVGASLMGLLGRRQSDGNPTMCMSCFTFVTRHHGGAEVDCTMLFADIRGSTSLAETMSATEFHALLDRFYATAIAIVFDHDGYIDKFVGDEVVALFFPLFSGDRHAALGVEAAEGLLRATGHAADGDPWVPLGVGVHTGQVWFGAVGDGSHIELTALGDAVNTTARLASLAAAGEILVTSDAATAAGLDPALERRSVELRGKQLATEVVTLRVGPATAAE